MTWAELTTPRACHDCGQAPAVTYWQAITGPFLCLACAEYRRAWLAGRRAA